jgi:hypothetical protein
MSQIFNHIRLTEETATPNVGDGVTVFWYTDRSAGTITRVSKSGKRFWFREDNAKRTDKLGMTDSGQTYEFTPNPDAVEEEVRMTKKGWRIGGLRGRKVAVGVRSHYHDFSF